MIENSNKSMNLKELSVLVNSCDSYSDLWVPFIELFNKFGGNNFNKVYLNSESDHKLNGISVIPTGFGTYGSRMVHALQRIDTEYVLILLDDFFVREQINFDTISRYVEIMNQNPEISCISFDYNLSGDETYEKQIDLCITSKFSRYKLNLQAGIWRTKDFIGYWDEFDNPWLWEIYGNVKAIYTDKFFLHVNTSENNPIKYGLNVDGNGMGVYRGKWVKDDVVPLFKKYGIVVDFEKRGFLQKNENGEHRLQYSFTDKIKYINKKLGAKFVVKYICFLISKSILKRSYNSFESYLENHE